MPDRTPLNGLKNALQQRQEALAAASGGLGVPTPPASPQTPTAAPMASPALAGLQGAAPRLEMSPDMRQQFSQDTGIQFNPAAQDIRLGIDPAELLKRADSLINRYK